MALSSLAKRGIDPASSAPAAQAGEAMMSASNSSLRRTPVTRQPLAVF